MRLWKRAKWKLIYWLLLIITTLLCNFVFPISVNITLFTTLTIISIGAAVCMFCFYHNLHETKTTVLTFLTKLVIVAYMISVVSQLIFEIILTNPENLVVIIEKIPHAGYFLHVSFFIKFFLLSLLAFLILRLFMTVAPYTYLDIDHDLAGWISLGIVLALLALDTVFLLHPEVTFPAPMIKMLQIDLTKVDIKLADDSTNIILAGIAVFLEIATRIIINWKTLWGKIKVVQRNVFKARRSASAPVTNSKGLKSNPETTEKTGNSNTSKQQVSQKMFDDFSIDGLPLEVVEESMEKQDKKTTELQAQLSYKEESLEPDHVNSTTYIQTKSEEILTPINIDNTRYKDLEEHCSIPGPSWKRVAVLQSTSESVHQQSKLITVKSSPIRKKDTRGEVNDGEQTHEQQDLKQQNMNHKDRSESKETEQKISKQSLPLPASHQESQTSIEVGLVGSIIFICCFIVLYIVYRTVSDEIVNVGRTFMHLVFLSLSCYSLKKNMEAREYIKLKCWQFKTRLGWID